MKTCSLDTNCLLSLILPGREPQAEKVIEILSKFECHVSDLVVSEIEFILSKACNLPRVIVAENLLTLINLDNINCNRNLFNKVISVYKERPALSFVDISIAIQSGLNNATPLYTFDRKLANQRQEAELL
jgi:predicted nucleic-acid-binding protein